MLVLKKNGSFYETTKPKKRKILQKIAEAKMQKTNQCLTKKNETDK